MCATRRRAKSNRSRCGTRSPSQSTSGVASGSRLTKTNPCHVSSRTGARPYLLEAEVVEVVGVLGPDELALEVVDPGVVRTLEADRLAARLLDDGRAAMPADVVEAAQDAVPAADDDERLVVDLGQEVGAGRRRVLLAPDDDPVAPEPLGPLELVDRRVVIGAPGQQRGGPVRLADGGDLVGGERDEVVTGGSWCGGQPSGTVFFGSRNGIDAVRAGQMPPSGATISSALPGPASAIGTHT